MRHGRHDTIRPDLIGPSEGRASARRHGRAGGGGGGERVNGKCCAMRIEVVVRLVTESTPRSIPDPAVIARDDGFGISGERTSTRSVKHRRGCGGYMFWCGQCKARWPVRATPPEILHRFRCRSPIWRRSVDCIAHGRPRPSEVSAALFHMAVSATI